MITFTKRRLAPALARLSTAVLMTILLAAAARAQGLYTGPISGGTFIFYGYEEQRFTGSSGSALFTAIVPVQPAGPVNASFTPATINVSSSDPVYGTINSTLDLSRIAAPTTIVSNAPPARFPATGTLRFYANATVTSKPGTFASNTELVLVNNNLQSVPPFSNETFTLENDVDFHSLEDPETVAFTLKAGSTSITVNDAPPPALGDSEPEQGH